jgi:hypothetical protein
VAACVGPAWAQYVGRVNQQAPQNGTHLRATAVVEYTGDLTKMKESRLVPIAIWDGMQYQPGGLYLAQPAPLAVLSGTQYELETAGKPEGFFNIRDSEDLAGQWVGVGSFEAPPAPKPRAPAAKRNHAYEVRDSDPDKPHFAHRPADQQNQGGDDGSGSGAGPNKQAAPPVDPDRPTLHPRSAGSGDSGSSNGGSGSANAPDTDPDRPTFHRQSNQSAAVPTTQPEVDPNRPHLEYKAPAEQEQLAKPSALFGVPKDMSQIAGVSDDRNGDTPSWVFSWANPDDENKMKAALEAIAEKAIAPAAAPAPVRSKATTPAARRKQHQAAQPAAPVLADEEFKAFSLSFGGGATMVLTARSTAAPVKYVTIVAEPDFYGQPKVLLQQVTSDNSLDVSPRYRLVDAVDTAGNGRADLIFELRGQTYRQFAIYRIAAGTATQAFVTQPTAN